MVSSDTLRTIVDGKSVLVAEKDNAPKKIKGGLKNFQFQIVRAEEGSDEYVIRKDGQYVCQYNNYFYMKADKSEMLSLRHRKHVCSYSQRRHSQHLK